MAQTGGMSPSLRFPGTPHGRGIVVRALGAAILAATTLLAQPAPTQSFDLGAGQKLEVRWVRVGSFTQGSPLTEADRSDDEYPRTVTLTKDFYLGTIEVTVGQFTRFVAATNYRTESEKGASGGFGWDGTQLVQRREFNWRHPGFPQTDEHPVSGVTYEDALAFCRWMQQRTGQAFDLPTEAQWEYAARAGEDTVWPGGMAADAVAWSKGNSSRGTQPVAQKAANRWGFHDLGGNVAEWCRDWYGPYAPAGTTAFVDPWLSSAPVGDKPRRVLRGGSWLRDAKHARVAARYRNDPKSRNADNGFRVSLPVSSPAGAGAPKPVEAPVATPPVPALPAAASPALVRPVRIPAPVPAPAVASAGPPALSGIFGLICPLGCVGIVGGLVYWVVQKFKRPPTSSPRDTFSQIQQSATTTWIPSRVLAPEAIGTEILSDGFRMLLTGVAVGELVRFTTRVGEQFFTDTVAYEPGANGHFVYTGARPAGVSILGIAAGSEQVLPGQTTLHEAGPGGMVTPEILGSRGIGVNLSTPSSSSERRRRNPSAYE